MPATTQPLTEPLLTGENQRVARLAGITLAVLGTCSLVGVASSLWLVNHAPLLLVALSPIGRHLILAAPVSDPVWFVSIAVVRRLLFYGACFHMGRALGERGVQWLEARAGRFGRWVRWLDGIFGRWGSWVVLLAAGPTVSVLAGISGMSPWRFVALVVPSLIARMLIVVGFAEWLRAPIEALLVWIDAHWLPGTAALLLAIALHQAWRHRRAQVG